MPSDTDIKQELSPTAAHVYDHLQWADGGPLTISELVNRTGRHPQTIREARHELVDANLVKESWSGDDARERRVELR